MVSVSNIRFGEAYHIEFRKAGMPNGVASAKQPQASNSIIVRSKDSPDPDNNLSDYVASNDLAAEVSWSHQARQPGWYIVTNGPLSKDYDKLYPPSERVKGVADVERQQLIKQALLGRHLPTITLEYQLEGDEQNPFVRWTNREEVLGKIQSDKIWKLTQPQPAAGTRA